MLSLRKKGDKIEIAFVKEEIEILQNLPDQLREIIENPDFTRDAARRLFPPGSEDPEVQLDYMEVAADSIREHKLANLDGFLETLQAPRKHFGLRFVTLTPEQVDFWIGFLNDMRLMIGTDIGVDSGTWGDDIDWGEVEDLRIRIYGYLSYLQSALLEAL
ncbi:MAG: hypothetical protein ACI9TH_001828 [Kiritimatiellia bacterium]|jgi:hypothetical protein